MTTPFAYAVPLIVTPDSSASGTPGETHLTQAQLNAIVTAAIAQWEAAGASTAQLAALRAVHFSASDFNGYADYYGHSGAMVAMSSWTRHATFDIDAAGHGWFVDPTPSDNSEFGSDLRADPASAAAGHLDLLTVVHYELGHALGLGSDSLVNDPSDLMYVFLADGERRIPDASDVAHANTTFSTGAISIPGATITTTGATSTVTPVAASGASVTTSIYSTASSAAPGNSGNDTTDAGKGGDLPLGGGADKFGFTHAVNYSFAEGDRFDFSALTSQFHAAGLSEAVIPRADAYSSGGFATLQGDKIDPGVQVGQLHIDQAHTDLLV